MSLSSRIAKQLRSVMFGGNWTGVNFEDTIKNINWPQATKKIDSFNTIAALVYHMNYYVVAIIKVLQGGPLDAHDKYAFDLPPINSEQDWDALVNKSRSDAETLATLIEQLPDTKLEEIFIDEKYGTYFRNLTGVIEHMHYHLGQIVMVRKMILR